MSRAGVSAIVLVLGALLAVAACVQGVERQDAATPTAPAATETPVLSFTATPTATAPPRPTPTATTVAGPSPTATTVAPPEATATPTVVGTSAVGGGISGGLFLQITNLPRESVVRTPTVAISGITNPDAVVSVNGVLVDVDAEGRFTTTIVLQAAPNLIEVVASDFRGNQVSAVLSIIYIP
ncbi:MAG: hypothetical protein HYX93_07215 [Chloroflexi bacterium]|nr:hypothetical protein [Chloroflexota bacterium]